MTLISLKFEFGDIPKSEQLRLTMEIPDVPIDVAVCDPELCRLMEQRLRLFLQEEKCYRRYFRQLQFRDLCMRNELEGPCNGPDCNFMIELLNHKRTFKDQENCTSSDCKVMRRIIDHWRKCNNYDCPICGPSLANLTKPSAEFGSAPAKEWHQRQSLSEAQRQHAVQLLVQFMKVRPNHVRYMPQVVDREAEKYFEADSLAEYYHLLAGKIWDIEMNRTHLTMELDRFYSRSRINTVTASVQQDLKEWQRSVTDGQRDHFITLLMERIRAEKFSKVNPDMYNSALEYMREQESKIYGTANSRSEYYHLIAELMWKKELREMETRETRGELLQIRERMSRMLQARLVLDNAVADM